MLNPLTEWIYLHRIWTKINASNPDVLNPFTEWIYLHIFHGQSLRIYGRAKSIHRVDLLAHRSTHKPETSLRALNPFTEWSYLHLAPRTFKESTITIEKWDRRFLKIAREISTWSKDPSTKVGACIYDRNRRPVSQGYNGLPQGSPDDPNLLNNRDNKLATILHAEVNAVLFANRDLDECTIYTYPFMPCALCASILVQKKIARVVSIETPTDIAERWAENLKLSIITFDKHKIPLVLYPMSFLEECEDALS